MQKDIKSFLKIICWLCIIAMVVAISECPFQKMTGLPCPGCNMMSACYYLLKADITTALYFHPLCMVLVVVVIVEGLLYLRYRDITHIYSKVLFYVFCGLLVGVYIYRMCTMYPNAPMMYDTENMISYIKALLF